MIRLFKNRAPDNSEQVQQWGLGHLEISVMEILWDRGESCVRDVVQRLKRPLAYTTVMTTLDRLFKKGLLNRHRPERAFLYSPRLSRETTSERASAYHAG